uniref:Tyr recombinase domain-containing protein n=1 Tax=Caenorhabditis japonica TaxID=281687 RepID=A0A8R1I9X4_CAEJA
MKKKEIEFRTQPTQVSREDVDKIVKTANPNNPKSDRDALITLISWCALLRASEAAELKWSDIERKGDLLEIRIRRAKNDQLAMGRSTSVEYKYGSDILLSRWRVRFSEAESTAYVFCNLNNRKQLTATSISKITKEALEKAGINGATHHSIRRGAANQLRNEGRMFEEVKAMGRWRSDAGLDRYLADSPEAQGHRK